MKIRTLAPIDYGCAGETRAYYSGASIISAPSYSPFDYEAHLRSAYSKTPARVSYFAMPSPSCEQRFDSTRRRRGIPNECKNIRSYYKCYHFCSGYDQLLNASTGYHRTVSSVWNRRPHVTSWVQPSIPMARPDALVSSNLRAEAYWTMRPRFEGEVSLINSLYELKDFKDIFKYINPKNLESAIESLNRFWHGPMNAARISGKAVATGHLINAFAAQPLIADFSAAIAQAQATVLEHQTALGLRDENQRYFTRVLDPIKNLSTVTRYIDYGVQTGSLTSTVFTAVMQYSQAYKPRSAYQAFVQYWGLNPLQIEAIWNGLPFSFLVDYIMSIGKSFHLMRRDPNIDIVPKYYTESVLQKRQTGAFIVPGSQKTLGALICNQKEVKYIKPSDFDDLHPQQVTGFEASNYHRYLTTPYQGPVLPRIKIPSSSQGQNMLALLAVLL